MNMIAIVLAVAYVYWNMTSDTGRLDLLDRVRLASQSSLDINPKENVGSKRVTVGELANSRDL